MKMKKVFPVFILSVLLFTSCASMMVSSKPSTFSRTTEPPRAAEIPEGAGVVYFYRITADQGAWVKTWVNMGSYGKFELDMNGYRAFLLPQGTYRARVSFSTGSAVSTRDFQINEKQVTYLEIYPGPPKEGFIARSVNELRALELMSDDHLAEGAEPIGSQISKYKQRMPEKEAAADETGSADASVSSVSRSGKKVQPIVTVFDFSFEGVSEKESQMLVDFLSGALFDTKAYRIIDRNQREAILSEIEFSLSGCIDESCQLEAGKLLAADYMVVGSLGKLGTRYVINAKLVEIETGETLLSARNAFDNVDGMLDGTSDIAKKLLFN